jgi:hypothetical protein
MAKKQKLPEVGYTIADKTPQVCGWLEWDVGNVSDGLLLSVMS